MASTLERSLTILEYLALRPAGKTLSTLADELALPLSACHRLLGELVRCGYVRQTREHGDYTLTTKLAALGLSYLGGSGIVELAQPVIDRLAETSGELVRLAIVDGDRLTFVAKAQGARFGLRYDPDMGIDLRLSCSAAGHAWLMTLPEDQAIAYVTEQGLGKPRDFGPNAPTSIRALLVSLDAHRRRGYSILQDVYAAGMSAMAAPIRRPGHQSTGILVVAGPSQRLTVKAMEKFGPALLRAASELAQAGDASPLLRSARVGTWGNGPAEGEDLPAD